VVALLEIEDLRVGFPTETGTLAAVGGLSLTVGEGETVAIVGESGSGKSVTAMSILRLIATPPARISGRVSFKGRDLFALPEAEMRRIRGNQISMIFQEPMSSLNPVMTVGAQIAEAVRLHQGASMAEAWRRAGEMLALVGIPAPQKRAREYPHQLSGGMRQRVMIAMALACNPELLIADEPTTALDVTVQAQILDLMGSLKARLGSAIILITHDLGVVAEIADRVVIMYGGHKVEEGTTRRIFAAARHPYTRGLLGAVPRLGSSLTPGQRGRLVEIPGAVPKVSDSDRGCPYAPRCPGVTDICREAAPPMVTLAPDHLVACHHAEIRSAA
jgi:peptide/nickel transport system ATP-binding protein